MQPKSSTSTQPVPANKEISHHDSKPDTDETMTATEDRETPADKETSEATQDDKRNTKMTRGIWMSIQMEKLNLKLQSYKRKKT